MLCCATLLTNSRPCTPSAVAPAGRRRGSTTNAALNAATDRTQQVSYCGRLSPIQRVLFGVPQGSVLGPLLYVLYTAELELIVERHGLHLHMYADDCQVYLNTSVEDVPLAVNKFAACVADINAWLSACRLRLNAAKTQLLWLGSSAEQQDVVAVDPVYKLTRAET